MSAADRLNKIEARNVPTTWFSDRQAYTAALVAALRAVLELHREGGYEVNGVFHRTECRACMQFDCPTVRAIEEALS